MKRGQRVTYISHRWTGSRFEVIERGGTVVQLDGNSVRVLTDFGPCRVWFAAARLTPVRGGAS